MSFEPPEFRTGTVLPSEVAIETVFGCNASCPMCFIDQPTERQKRVMKMEVFERVVADLEPHKDHITRFDMWSLGEPFIDPYLEERVGYVKDRGFNHVAVSTNADLMTPERAQKIMEMGLDTLIISIDGTTAEVHEALRPGTNFELVDKHAREAVRIRDENNYGTRFLIRFIEQGKNAHQWDAYREYWREQLSQSRKDNACRYRQHNYGGYTGNKQEMLGDNITEEMERMPCRYVFETLQVLSDGSLCLCPADFLHASMGIGDVHKKSPIEAFNGERYRDIRELHACGEKNDMQICKDCTILYSMYDREFLWEMVSHTHVPRRLQA